MGKKLIDLLVSKKEFINRGEPTMNYNGMGSDNITESVDELLNQNTSSPDDPYESNVGPDLEAESVIRNLKEAVQRDPALASIIEGIQNIDDILSKKLDDTNLGSAYLQGFLFQRYKPEGFGRQYPNNPGLADEETVQLALQNGVEFDQLKDAGSKKLKNIILNQEFGENRSRFRQGLLSDNIDDAKNEILQFYGQSEESKPSLGTAKNADIRKQSEAAQDANLAKAADTPQKESLVSNILKLNRFRPNTVVSQGYSQENFLGAEYRKTNINNLIPSDPNDLPFEKVETRSTEQSNRQYLRSPAANPLIPNDIGGLAAVADEKIDQMNENNLSPYKIGTERRTVEEIIRDLEGGGEILVKLKAEPNYLNKEYIIPETMEQSRYAGLEKDFNPDYLEKLDQEIGQFVNKDVPGLREIGISHLVYEMSKFRKTGKLLDIGDRSDDNLSFGERLRSTATQAGNSLFRAIQEEVGRLSGRSKEVSRALTAPRGSAQREVLKRSETPNIVAGNQNGLLEASSQKIDKGNLTGAQDPNSFLATLLRLRRADMYTRRMLTGRLSEGNGTSGTKISEPLQSLKDVYQEGFTVSGNFERSYKAYQDDFIGLAEDVQTVRDFLIKNGVERFYLSRNQTLISPFNNKKGRGMEQFGIPLEAYSQNDIDDVQNTLGNVGSLDAQSTINRARDLTGIARSAFNRIQGRPDQVKLAFGKSPDQNVLGTSRALEFMHSGLKDPRDTASIRMFAPYVHTTKNNMNMNVLLAEQIGRNKNMATQILPQSTLINSMELRFNVVGKDEKVDIQNTSKDNGTSDNARAGGRIRRLLDKVDGVFDTYQDARSGVFSGRTRKSLEAGLFQLYNDPDQLDESGKRVSAEAVRTIEEALESQYVPFYFQDLRTNEIIAFHAFLKDVIDGFNPNYDKKKYIGRVDPVAIYQGSTDRTISVSFFVVSTNNEDFATMYEKVNRFIGFVYPQYDNGETYDLKIGDNFENGNQYVALFANKTKGQPKIPFSQKQKAGPVVRMRIGDIIKDRAFDDNISTVPTMMERAEIHMGIQDVANILQKNSENKDVTLGERYNEITSDPQLVTSIRGANQEIAAYLEQNGYVSINGTSVLDLSFISDTGELQFPTEIPTVDGQTAIANLTTITEAGETATYDYNSDPNLLSQQIQVLQNLVQERISNSNNIVGQISQLNSLVQIQSAIVNSNAVIRKAFTMTGGRGLPGVIEGLKFSNFTDFQWEIQPGMRAPMMFEISFNFTVLHTLPPGLDDWGEMRPVYAPKIQDSPVGAVANPLVPFEGGVLITGDLDLANMIAEPRPIGGSPRGGGGGRIIGSVVSDVTVDISGIHTESAREFFIQFTVQCITRKDFVFDTRNPGYVIMDTDSVSGESQILRNKRFEIFNVEVFDDTYGNSQDINGEAVEYRLDCSGYVSNAGSYGDIYTSDASTGGNSLDVNNLPTLQGDSQLYIRQGNTVYVYANGMRLNSQTTETVNSAQEFFNRYGNR